LLKIAEQAASHNRLKNLSAAKLQTGQTYFDNVAQHRN
jgi:hypothetical protein